MASANPRSAATREKAAASSQKARPHAAVAVGDSKVVAIYDSLVAASMPGVERKGADNPYTSLNGNMFTLLHQSKSLAIRLPQGAREEFLKKHNTTLFFAYGVVMKEYVAVPEDLLDNTREMKKYLQLSYEYAKTLKPKPTNAKGAETKAVKAGKKSSSRK